jgi:hypothetical protein
MRAMKVIRCPSCGARYNADRLPAGAVFDCNRCGSSVAVPSGSSASVSLLIGGLLLIAALFFWSADLRTPGLVRPWEAFLDAGLLAPKVGAVLWAVLGLWAVVTALLTEFRHRSAFTLGLGALALLLALSSNGAGYTIGGDRPLPFMLGSIALAAGFVLVMRGVRGAATTGLLLGGSLLLLAFYAFGFEASGMSKLEWIVAELRGAFAGTLDRADNTFSHLVGDVGVHLAVVLASLGGVLMALGVRAAGFALAMGLLLAFAILVPGATRFGEIFQEGFEWSRFGTEGARALGSALVADGVALWALLAWASADLAAAEEVTS